MLIFEEKQPSTLPNSLKSILTQYLDKNRHLSLTGLAANNRKIGKSTLYNIIKNTGQRPSNRTILGVIEAINPGKSWDTIAEQYKEYPEVYEILRCYCQDTCQGNSKSVLAPAPFAKALINQDTFRAAILAQSDDGVTVATIEKEFGRDTLAEIEKLVASGTITKSNGKFYATTETINSNQETVKKLASNLINKSYDIDAFNNSKGTSLVEKKNNELRVLYQTDVDLKTVLPKVSKAILKCREEILKILGEPDSKGDDVFWSVLASDSLLKQPYQHTDNAGRILQ